jgi:hypothetical protein
MTREKVTISHDCPPEVQELMLMHDETNPTKHRELTRKGEDLTWELIDFLKRLHSERGTKEETTNYIGKGVLLWIIISILTIIASALVLAAKHAVAS